MQRTEVKKYYQEDIQNIFSFLNTSETGLDLKEAQNRLLKNGPNEIKIKKSISWFNLLIKQLDLMSLLLFFAFVIAYFTGSHLEAFVILGILFFNIGLKFFEEFWTTRLLLILQKNILDLKAKVKRDKKIFEIESKNLAMGDIVLLQAGDMVPADIRIFEANNLKVKNDILTGESAVLERTTEPIPGETDLVGQTNMAFYGTSVVEGEGFGVVVVTGSETEFGKIITITASQKIAESHLLQEIKRWAKIITFIFLAAVLIIFILGIKEGISLSSLLLLSLSLIVAAIPTELPTVMILALSLAMRRLLTQNIVIKKLSTIEELGLVSVICTDKTGTLTKNEIEWNKIFINNKIYSVEEIDKKTQTEAVDFNLLMSRFKKAYGHHIVPLSFDPIEISLSNYLKKHRISSSILEKNISVADLPFSSERKFSIHFYDHPIFSFNDAKSSVFGFMRAAPEIILKFCNRIYLDEKIKPLSSADRELITKAANQYAALGNYVVALGFKDYLTRPEKIDDSTAENFVFYGLFIFGTQLKEGVKEAVRYAYEAKIRIMMLTGDSEPAAIFIAKESGLDRGGELTSIISSVLEKMTDRELVEMLMDKRKVLVFSRITPTHKLRIVKLLEAARETVLVTGDGVNDAPALIAATVGMAMGKRGTDAAKEAADVIITDDHFASIIKAIKEGRLIYHNLRKILIYVISGDLAESLLILLGSVFSLPSPLIVNQILGVDLVAHIPTSLVIADAPESEDLFRQPPRPRSESIINFEVMRSFLTIGIFLALVSFWIYLLSRIMNFDYSKQTTLTFITLTFGQILGSLVYHGSRFRNIRRLKMAFFAVSGIIALALGLIYLPYLEPLLMTVKLSLGDWLLIFPPLLVILVFDYLVINFKYILTQLRKVFIKN